MEAVIPTIVDAILRAYAALAMMPFLTFALVWGGVYLYKREKKVAITRAMDVTTIFLVGVVATLFNIVFNSGFGFYLLLLLFLIGFGLLGNIQQRTKGKVDLKRITRAIWRLGFIGLSAAYLLLLTIGLTLNLLGGRG